jgi:GNAT superfamily N-acetyltransferase
MVFGGGGAGHGLPHLFFHVHDQERSDVGHALAVPDVDVEDAVRLQDVGQRLLSAALRKKKQKKKGNRHA